jgi:hypothetical protein
MAAGVAPPRGTTAPAGALFTPGVERQAAARLGTIYLKLARMGEGPLGPWAIAPDRGRGNIHGPFYAVLGEVYGSDTERERQHGRANYQSRFALYKKDYDAVVPKLLTAVFSFASLALSAEQAALNKLWTRLATETALADWLHKACQEILRQRVSKEFGAELRRDIQQEEATRAGSASPDTADSKQAGYNISYLSPTEVKKLVRARLAKVVRYAGEDVLNILFEHPEGMTILAAYAESAGKGTVAALVRVSQATRALGEFTQKAVDKKQALRYPFFITGAVGQRNLADVPGFPQFAVSLGQVLARDAVESALSFAAVAVGCLALVFVTPASPALVTAAFALADLSFASVSLGMTFVREREQDLGSQGGAFRGQANQFVTPVVYLDTALAGAATLLAAIAFFSAVKDVRAALKASAKAPGAPPAPPPSPPDGKRLITAENKANEARAKDGLGSTSDPLTGNSLTKREPPDEVYVISTSSKEEANRAIAKDMERQRAENFRQSIGETEDGQPQGTAKKTDPAPEQQRLTNRPLEPRATAASDTDSVPVRTWREEERANIQRQIADKEQEYRRIDKQKAPVGKEMQEVAAKLRTARRSGNQAEIARLEAELERVANDYEGYLYELKKTANEKDALRQYLDRTSRYYYDALTSAASKRPEYVAVKEGELAKFFKPLPKDDVLGVTAEHVRPRSVIFQKPGFLDKIIWDQQIFLFNLKKNLKGAPALFNVRRGTVPYSRLNREFWGTYIKGEKELGELISIEGEVDRDIEKLLANPKNTSLWRSYGYDGPFK